MLCFDYRVVTKEEGSKVDQFANYACKPNVLGGGGGGGSLSLKKYDEKVWDNLFRKSKQQSNVYLLYVW